MKQKEVYMIGPTQILSLIQIMLFQFGPVHLLLISKINNQEAKKEQRAFGQLIQLNYLANISSK